MPAPQIERKIVAYVRRNTGQEQEEEEVLVDGTMPFPEISRRGA